MNTQEKHSTPFIPAALDDYGLSPAQFRVLCAIARRGECFETAAALAKRCRVERKTLYRTLRELVEIKAIERQSRFGQTTIYRIRAVHQWQPATVPDGRCRLATQPQKQTTRCPKRHTTTCPQRPTTEGTPTKVLPLSYSPTQADDPLFISTWEKWMEFRRGLCNKPRNIEGMFAEQLAWLAGYPNAVAIEIIQQSLRNGWQGLFPPKGGVRTAARSAGEIYADYAKGF